MKKGIGDFGNPIGDSGNVKVNIAKITGTIVESNSSNTPLAGDATFTGEWVEGKDVAIIYVTITADEPSATDGVCIQFSTDGVNIDGSDEYTYPNEGSTKTYSFQSPTKYFRTCYTNGATINTVFRLQTVIKSVYGKPSSHRIQGAIVDEDDAELIKAVISGKNPQDIFVNFGATTSGNFKISLEEFENDVSVNSNTQLKITPYHEDGTEGNLITGIDYVAGKSGIDASTETLQSTDYEHHEIHEGKHFNMCDYDLDAANAEIIDFVMTTPDTLEEPHLTFKIAASLGATLEVYEGATGISGGTAVTPINNNRRSSNASIVSLLQDPTISLEGTRIAGFLAGGSRVAGFSTRDKEDILDRNISYLFRITSLAQSNEIEWCASWYEHTPKN